MAIKLLGPFFIKSLDWDDKFRFTRNGITFTYLGEGEYRNGEKGKKQVCADHHTKVYLIT